MHQTPGEPLVIGAIGRYDRSVVETMAAGQGVNTDFTTDEMWISSDAPLARWRSGAAEGRYWGAIDPAIRPFSLQSARGDAAASGVVLDDSKVTLHGDLMGMRPLYYTRKGGALYFCNRLQPVLEACEAPTLDAYAWTAMLTLWYVPPGRSIVSEVRTLRLGEIIQFNIGNQRFSSTIDTVTVDHSPSTSVQDLVVALGYSAVQIDQPAFLLLSGGFDSRFLLGCALQAGASPATVTTSKDDGFDFDIEIAATVARIAKVPHERVAGSGAWDSWFEKAARRMDYTTPHHAWALPLADELRAWGRPAICGFGGGVVLNSHMQDTQKDLLGKSTQARLDLFSRLGAYALGQDGPISPDLKRRYGDRLKSDFLAHTAAFAERPDWQAMSILTTRTARSISTLATRLIGPEVPVSMPYLTPSFLRIALSPAIHARRGDDLYKELLAYLGGHIGETPSESDYEKLAAKYQPRRQLPATFESIARRITSDQVALSVLHPRLQHALQNDPADLVGDGLRTADENAIHGALLLAMFKKQYPMIRDFSDA